MEAIANDGWVGTITALSGNIDITDMSCPDCESDEQLVWDEPLELNIKCESCNRHDTYRSRDLLC